MSEKEVSLADLFREEISPEERAARQKVYDDVVRETSAIVKKWCEMFPDVSSPRYSLSPIDSGDSPTKENR